ncbi:MAG: hypothetical protein ACLU38_09745 [Dysosmobacter sp.]
MDKIRSCTVIPQNGMMIAGVQPDVAEVFRLGTHLGPAWLGAVHPLGAGGGLSSVSEIARAIIMPRGCGPRVCGSERR